MGLHHDTFFFLLRHVFFFGWWGILLLFFLKCERDASFLRFFFLLMCDGFFLGEEPVVLSWCVGRRH